MRLQDFLARRELCDIDCTLEAGRMAEGSSI